MNTPSHNTTRLAITAVMIALVFIFSRFLGITTDVIHLGFDFLPVAVIAALYGPLWAAAAYILGDLACAILVPMGVINPGITLMAGLIGLTLGLFLYSTDVLNSRSLIVRSLSAAFISAGIIKLFGTTACLSVAYGSPYWGLLISRIPNCAILFLAMAITLPLLYRLVIMPIKRHI